MTTSSPCAGRESTFDCSPHLKVCGSQGAGGLGQGVWGRGVRGGWSGGGGSVGRVVTQLVSSAALTGDQGEGFVAIHSNYSNGTLY